MMGVASVNGSWVPKSEADQIVKVLEENKTPVWYLAAKDEGHGFTEKKNADFQLYPNCVVQAEVPSGQ